MEKVRVAVDQDRDDEIIYILGLEIEYGKYEVTMAISQIKE